MRIRINPILKKANKLYNKEGIMKTKLKETSIGILSLIAFMSGLISMMISKRMDMFQQTFVFSILAILFIKL